MESPGNPAPRTSGLPVQTDGGDNFSPRAQQALVLSREEAGRLKHNFVGTEHVLLGLIKLGQGTAFNVLEKKGINLEALRIEVEKLVGTGPDHMMIGNISYTPRVIKVIALAQKEAKQLNDGYVGTGHLLLGLLREGDGVAAKVLKSLDINLEQARQDILCEHGSNIASENSGGQRPIDLTNLTPRAQQVLVLAREEAGRLNHGVVGTEHLLLGLIALGQGAAAKFLAKMGLNLENASAGVEKYLPKEPDQKSIVNFSYTPQLKEVFSLANKERRKLDHAYLGTEHLLLGILGVADGVIAKIWTDFGMVREQIRTEILRELDPNFSAVENRINTPPTIAMEPQSETPPEPKPGNPKTDSVGAGKRYDVYCTERSTEMVVYRNALFKGIKRLLNSSQHDAMGQFIELEQADGQTIFISRFTVIRFCEPGTTPGGETISPAKPM